MPAEKSILTLNLMKIIVKLFPRLVSPMLQCCCIADARKFTYFLHNKIARCNIAATSLQHRCNIAVASEKLRAQSNFSTHDYFEFSKNYFYYVMLSIQHYLLPIHPFSVLWQNRFSMEPLSSLWKNRFFWDPPDI